ncbi:50S ribosomal protein L2 [Candidatus Pacearchaeota archaeon CG10_big_fil_rev_8_21_14_0_10_35_219]|nr:50S ribosomal protein L2 [Candidatus Pacearchaeota archaeon]OIO42318.1 MAG: 50S ribosomal protein L2 [Candidatus Pacearchaeota archaeon CG1_02_35_32]PIO07447.1 MAG: 50S ribosomal protein L2 [Candidatus Pacearchaeota archaeon CG10_big_fil_rev_8_21_14_0_10_35_219]PIY81253.1 MAG: 50S ribosomal protein L2 [Candidatus Pacearchaeota archaeon CG_4_10_14_0_8_um_filter_35_169]PIZ80182.1 MAG: 50S ribosomal protein L2 [Candidatus Pacearchaeota archaeon CG_4_10_14_0_2_um_filter_35_33]PJA69553.1 MAG: 50
MGKRIIQQARGKGSLTYRVRKKAFRRKVKYPLHEGTAKVVKILHSSAHSAPLMKLEVVGEMFYNVAFNGASEGIKVSIGKGKAEQGNILALQNIPVGTKIYNIERNPGDGGKMIRAAGSSAVVSKKYEHNKIGITMPNRKEIKLDRGCRATIGVVAGEGKKQKPFLKAGRKYYKMKARGKLYPRISAVSVNAIDHPFGSGRGKRIKSKIAKRNAPPGRKVGHLRPRRTGKKK